jgi:carbonic anhydrase
MDAIFPLEKAFPALHSVKNLPPKKVLPLACMDSGGTPESIPSLAHKSLAMHSNIG